MTVPQLGDSLRQLRDALAPVRLPLPLPGAQVQAQAAHDIVAQLNDYVLPRLGTLDAPLLAVVGGSTGAGKSTLVNSVIGRRVTIPGVIRPTTRGPVLVHHPDDEQWFLTDRILPGMARSHGASLDSRSLQLVAEPTIPQGLALLDAPDVDSVVKENRELAAQLLAAADLWLFVTSAARYADAVPWEYLRHAAERSAAVAVVCNRVPPAAFSEVPPHLAQMMTERGLASSPLFAVPETGTDADGMLPNAAVSPIRDWLAELAADQKTRQQVVIQTLDGAVGNLVLRAPRVAQAVRDQVAAIIQLQSDADAAFTEASRAIAVQTADGTLLRGEVLARWHDFVGTGEIFRALDEKVGWLRDRLKRVFTGAPQNSDNVTVAVEAGLEALIREEVEKANERAEAAWMANPAGRAIIENSRVDLRHTSAEFPRAAARAVRDWQGDILELVGAEGQGKRTTARFMAVGVNTVSVALMLAIFAHTGGLTGAEVGVAGGAAALSQRILESVFGDDAVRRLAKRGKEMLDTRIEGLVAAERDRFYAALAEQQVTPEQIDQIDAAVKSVEEARLGGLGFAAASSENLAISTGDPVSITAAPVTADTAALTSNLEIVDAEIV
ncbi:MAG: GTPase [Propionibacteriaceae bacterium]